jgi:hypothetical protein
MICVTFIMPTVVVVVVVGQLGIFIFADEYIVIVKFDSVILNN